MPRGYGRGPNYKSVRQDRSAGLGGRDRNVKICPTAIGSLLPRTRSPKSRIPQIVPARRQTGKVIMLLNARDASFISPRGAIAVLRATSDSSPRKSCTRLIGLEK